MWRALEEQGAAPAAAPRGESPPAGAGEGRPSSSEGPGKTQPISAIPGYSGHVPNRLRSLDGRFQVSNAASPNLPTAPTNHSVATTEYDRDIHVSGYTGYVPREFSTATGKSRWDAVTNGYREPGPDDIKAGRTLYA